ncbi:hypothetical protein K3495_g11837 [Podosphaera aphanis]|nr:hypothetical protein K3495_g11837 [Podosphaera aphanis]
MDSQDNNHNWRPQAGDLDDSGDTVMGEINTASVERRRAKWKIRAEIEKLKQEGCCFRCKRQGCITSRCPLLPAKKPKNLRVNSVTLPEIDPSTFSRTWEPKAACSEDFSLNTNPFLVNALLNDTLIVQSLVDNGCLCYETAENSSENKPIIKEIAFVSLDLDGFVTPKLWLYVVPHSTHQLILGKKWLEDQDAVIHSKEQRLELRKAGGSVYSVKRWRQEMRYVARPRNTSITKMASMIETVPIYRASLEDISKALRDKPDLSVQNTRDRLPEEVQKFAHLFADNNGANDLPPCRGSLDHAIILRENGKRLTPTVGGGEEESLAFENLKYTFASTPVLAQWSPKRETVLEADCSGYALGGCLSQLDDQKRLRPIAYFSRRLSGAEANYLIHDKEMLAIVACLKEWQAELRSAAKPFTILSDHRNLNYFASKKLLNERQVRYNDVLQQFNFELKWRSGNSSEHPDAIFRREQDKPMGLDDERNAGRLLQLLPNISLNPIDTKEMGQNNNEEADPAALVKLSEDEEMQSLRAIVKI